MVSASHPPAGRPASFVGWLVAERILRLGIAAVVLALVARHLQPEGFGALNFALSIVGTVMPLALLGLESVVVRELVRTPQRSAALLGTALILRLGVGLLCGALLFLAAAQRPAFLGPLVVLGPLCLTLVLQAGETPDLWFRRHVQSRAAVTARIIAIVVGAAAKLVLVGLGAGVAAFAWVTAAEIALFVGGIGIAYSRTAGRPAGWRWDSDVARELLRASWGPAVAGFLGAIAFRIDQFFINALLGAEPLGLYFAALRLIEVPGFLAVTVTTALFPALAATPPAGQQDQLVTLFGVNAALAWLTAIGCTVVAPWLLPLLFGRAYSGASSVLVLHAWATLPYFAAVVRAQLLVLDRQPGLQSIIALVTLGTQIVLNALFIPRWGIAGAATAFLLTQIVGAWLMPLLLPPLRASQRPQWRGFLLPLQPSAWPRLIAVFRPRPAS